MLKFKFNYQQNTLAYQKGEYWNEISPERTFTGKFGSSGFKLNNGWLSFNLYENKIRVFAKLEQSQEGITYYRKDLPKQCPVIFTFTEKDEIAKINGTWKRKYA